MPKRNDLNARLKRVRLVIFDVDGVLTDGGIYLMPDGAEVKRFNVLDGTGIKYLDRAGIRTCVLSGRRSRATTQRARELDMTPVLQGYKRKIEGFHKILRQTGFAAEDACMVGDDLPDIPVLREVGLAVAVANARPEVRAMAHWVTTTCGGFGAAREIAERILKTQGKWGEIVGRYGIAAGNQSTGAKR